MLSAGVYGGNGKIEVLALVDPVQEPLRKDGLDHSPDAIRDQERVSHWLELAMNAKHDRIARHEMHVGGFAIGGHLEE